VRADPAAVAAGAQDEVHGAAAVAVAVARTFAGRARAARLALLDGYAGAARAPDGQPRVVFGFTVELGRVVEIELIADPEQLGRLDVGSRGPSRCSSSPVDSPVRSSPVTPVAR
jgi:hypothetical protein